MANNSSLSTRKTKVSALDSLKEVFKSLRKDYILNRNSPYFLWHNRNRVIFSVSRNPLLLNQVPDDMIKKELDQPNLDPEGILMTAIDSGYILNNSKEVLTQAGAKTFLIEYFRKRLTIPAFGFPDELIGEQDFQDAITDIALNSDYHFQHNTPNFLKKNKTVATKNLQLLLNEKDLPKIQEIDIALKKHNIDLNNTDIISQIIKVYRENGIKDEDILGKICSNPEKVNEIKNNPQIVAYLFDNVKPKSISSFFNIFFNQEELQTFLSNQTIQSSKLGMLRKLYERNPQIINTIEWELLDEEYGLNEQQTFAIGKQDEKTQDNITKLSPFRKKLMIRIFNTINSKTSRWNDYYANTMVNINDGFFEELLEDLFNEATHGNTITQEDIEKLTLLLSGTRTFGYSYALNQNQVKELSNNYFQINTKRDLENYDAIRREVCDFIINNPTLEAENADPNITKRLTTIKTFSVEDRLKFALLEKFYGIDISTASHIASKYSKEINEIDPKDENERNILLSAKAICRIMNCENVELLQQIGKLPYLALTDIDQGVLLDDQIKGIFNDRFKDTFTMPREENREADAFYNGKRIKVYDAGTDFAFISKFIWKGSTKKIWDSSTKDIDGSNRLRFHTCCSYLTPENILYNNRNNDVFIGFSQSMKGFSIESVYDGDAHSSFYGDSIAFYSNGVFRTPENLVSFTASSFENRSPVYQDIMK